MNAEFNVWLLIVGLVAGAGLAWLVMMDSRRRETEIDATELPREAAWLSAVMTEDGRDISPDDAEELLRLHRAYLGAPPPDPVPELAPDWTLTDDDAPDREAPSSDGPSDLDAEADLEAKADLDRRASAS